MVHGAVSIGRFKRWLQLLSQVQLPDSQPHAQNSVKSYDIQILQPPTSNNIHKEKKTTFYEQLHHLCNPATGFIWDGGSLLIGRELLTEKSVSIHEARVI